MLPLSTLSRVAMHWHRQLSPANRVTMAMVHNNCFEADLLDELICAFLDGIQRLSVILNDSHAGYRLEIIVSLLACHVQ